MFSAFAASSCHKGDKPTSTKPKVRPKKKAKPAKAKAKAKARGTQNEVHVLNGPNLDMLGYLDPDVYGQDTLSTLEKKIEKAGREADSKVRIRFFQTNDEGELLEYLHALVLGMSENGHLAGVILNLSSWTHTSIALRDAVAMLKPVPLVEVQIANPAGLEEFRQFSVIEDLVDYRVLGMGQDGYLEALRWLLSEMTRERLDVH